MGNPQFQLSRKKNDRINAIWGVGTAACVWLTLCDLECLVDAHKDFECIACYGWVSSTEAHNLLSHGC